MTPVWIALALATAELPRPPAHAPITAGPPVAERQLAQVIEAAADRFATYWARGELEGLARLLSSSGLVLHLERAGSTPLPRRRALAALREFLRGYETVGVQVLRAVETGGSPPRGFAEVRWIAVPTGTSESITVGIFVGFLHEEPGWRVSEIRFLR